MIKHRSKEFLLERRKNKMEIGEKYLKIKIVGHEIITAFPNKEGREKNNKAPHYKADGIAIWIQEKKAPNTEQTKTEDILWDMMS